MVEKNAGFRHQTGLILKVILFQPLWWQVCLLRHMRNAFELEKSSHWFLKYQGAQSTLIWFPSSIPLRINQESLFLMSKEWRHGFLALSITQSPSFMAFRLQLHSSITSMWHGWDPVSLVPSGGGDDKIDRNAVSAGVWLSWNYQGLRLWSPCLDIHGSENKNDKTNSSSNFTAGPRQLSMT